MNGKADTLYTHFTKKAAWIARAKVANVESDEKNITFYAELECHKHICPCCGNVADTIRDYHKQCIREISAFGKSVAVVLRRRGYRCNKLRKTFFGIEFTSAEM